MEGGAVQSRRAACWKERRGERTEWRWTNVSMESLTLLSPGAVLRKVCLNIG